jgi:acetylglutamate kinase
MKARVGSEATGNLVLLEAAKKLSSNCGYTPLQLREAIPYIREFHHKVMVVKIGGSVLYGGASQRIFLEDVIFLTQIGVRMVLVHGGSHQLSDRMKAAGLTPNLKNGERYTDARTLALAVQVFGEINATLVDLIKQAGGEAIGFPPGKGSVVRAARKGTDAENFVGRVTDVDTERIFALREEYIPVITCIGSNNGDLFNINADEVAARIARALRAEKLILTTDVDGVMDADNRLISTLTLRQAKSLVSSQVISSGMIPKVNVCLDALRCGVHKTHIISGKREGSLLCEVLTDSGVGTEIVMRKRARLRRSA